MRGQGDSTAAATRDDPAKRALYDSINDDYRRMRALEDSIRDKHRKVVSLEVEDLFRKHQELSELRWYQDSTSEYDDQGGSYESCSVYGAQVTAGGDEWEPGMGESDKFEELDRDALDLVEGVLTEMAEPLVEIFGREVTVVADRSGIKVVE